MSVYKDGKHLSFTTYRKGHLSMSNSKKTTPVVQARQAVTGLEAKLAETREDRETRQARLASAQGDVDRIGQALEDGDTTISESAITEARHGLDAARYLRDAADRAVTTTEARLTEARGVLIGETIRAEAGDYSTMESLNAERVELVDSFITELDKLADRAEAARMFVTESVEQLRRIDGGGWQAHGNRSIGGAQRVQEGHGQVLEVDGEPVYTTDAQAVFADAAEAIEYAGMPTVRYQRKGGDLEDDGDAAA